MKFLRRLFRRRKKDKQKSLPDRSFSSSDSILFLTPKPTLQSNQRELIPKHRMSVVYKAIMVVHCFTVTSKAIPVTQDEPLHDLPPSPWYRSPRQPQRCRDVVTDTPRSRPRSTSPASSASSGGDIQTPRALDIALPSFPIHPYEPDEIASAYNQQYRISSALPDSIIERTESDARVFEEHFDGSVLDISREHVETQSKLDYSWGAETVDHDSGDSPMDSE